MNSFESAVPDSQLSPPSESDTGTPAESPGLVETEQVNDNDLPPQSDDNILPVVGLGGSAGSIQVLQQFFDAVRPDLGIAYVVVIHLAPEYESSLAQIIAARTGMKVVQVTEPTEIAPNCVYVIPPSRHLSMRDSKLYLTEPQQERGQRVAVDLLFRTLAATHRSKAVAVVLSGNDGDGSIGIKRIKEHGGVTIAQDPYEAEFDGMPRSAIETGMVDWILPITQIASKVGEWIENERNIHLPTPEQIAGVTTEEADVIALREILAFLLARTGHDFSHYKRATVLRRIGRRLQVNSLVSLPQYADFIRTHPGEAGALLQDLLISVTNFFRDPESFAALESHLPSLFRESKNGAVRVWIAGCATGEEAYSVAMLLQEYADTLDNRPEVQLFATDLDEDALQFARNGLYPQSIVADVSPERLRRFFNPEAGRYRIRKELRERVLFAPHNLLQDAPFSRLDLVTCRNLLIYFNREAQERVMGVFHFALRPNGMLFLGTSESAEDSPLFHSEDRKHRLYRKQGNKQVFMPLLPMLARPVAAREFPRLRHGAIPTNPLSGENLSLESLPISPAQIHEHLLIQVAPASILVNSDYDMVRIANNAGRYLQHIEGDVSTNVLLAVPFNLRAPLRIALFDALQTRHTTEVAPVIVQIDGRSRQLRVRVQPQTNLEGTSAEYAVLLFEESAPDNSEPVPVARSESEETIRRLEDELQQMRGLLRATIEEHDVSNEELKAYNEELQALNEEQRSASEELETSREEIQAANEELTTVNAELKFKIEEVGRANSDLQNLIASTDIATVFLSRDLRIKRYTPRAVELFNFIPTDTGRPLTDLKHDLSDDHFVEDTSRVLQTLTPIDREVRAKDGRWFLSRVAPYRTFDDRIDGVVLTLVDITEQRKAEQAARQAQLEQAFLLQLGDALRPLTDPTEVQRVAARLLGEHLQVERAFYGELLDDGDTLVIGLGYAHEVSLLTGTVKFSEFDSDLVSTYRAGQTAVINDVDEDASISAQGQAAFNAIQVRAALGVPLVKDGEVRAILSIHQSTPRQWTPEEVRLTEEVAERTWAAVERARVEVALSRSEEKYRTLFETIDEGFCIFELIYDDQGEVVDWIYTEANPAFEKQTGFLNPIGKRISEFQPDLERSWFEQFAQVARTGESVRFVQYTEAMGIWYDVYAGRIDANRVSLLFTDVTERKNRELQGAFLLQLSDTLRSLSDATAIEEEACRLLGVHLKVNRAYYPEINEEQGTARVEREFVSGSIPSLASTYPLTSYGWMLPTLRRGEAVVVADIHRSDEIPAQDVAAMEALQLVSILCVPLVNMGRLIGAFTVGSNTARNWKTYEIELVRDTLERTWAATFRARAEAALAESEQSFRAFVTASSQAVYKMSADWTEMRTLTGNDFLLDTFNPTRTWLDTYIPLEARPQVLASIEAAIRTKTPFQLEHPVTRANASIGWTFSRAVPLLDDEGNITEWFGTAIDVTERREAQEELQQSQEVMELLERRVEERTRELAQALSKVQGLVKQVVGTQEEERGRISRELHDNLGQHLTAVMLGLQTLEYQLATTTDGRREQATPQLAQLREVVDSLMRAAHRQAWELRPAELDSMGLAAALDQYTSDWAERTGMEVDFQSDDWEVRPNMEIETTFYRVAQEALTNVARHAQAALVTVVLKSNANTVSLVVEDNGIGFDTEQVTARLGVVGMRERMSLIGGTLEIESIPEEGTAVIAQVNPNGLQVDLAPQSPE